MRIRNWRAWLAVAAVAAIVVSISPRACAERRDPVVVRDGMLVLENQTAGEWRSVRVTINDHFSGGVAALRPGGLMTAPLRDFQSGFGHKFEPWRMSVQKVRVTAAGADGPVDFLWTFGK